MSFIFDKVSEAIKQEARKIRSKEGNVSQPPGSQFQSSSSVKNCSNSLQLGINFINIYGHLFHEKVFRADFMYSQFVVFLVFLAKGDWQKLSS